MNGLQDMKWEETDTDTSTSDSMLGAALKSSVEASMGVISRKHPLMTTGMKGRTDILYQAKILWTSEDADSGDYAVINKKYSSYWINNQTGECSSGSIVLEASVNHSLPDGLLKEEEHIMFHLQLKAANKSYNTYVLAIKSNRTSSSTSLEVPSGINRFMLLSNLSKMGSCMILDILLKSETYGESKYWFSQTQCRI